MKRTQHGLRKLLFISEPGSTEDAARQAAERQLSEEFALSAFRGQEATPDKPPRTSPLRPEGRSAAPGKRPRPGGAGARRRRWPPGGAAVAFPAGRAALRSAAGGSARGCRGVPPPAQRLWSPPAPPLRAGRSRSAIISYVLMIIVLSAPFDSLSLAVALCVIHSAL